MNAKALIGGLVVFVGMVILAVLYQFGPPGIKAGQNRILASLQLTNGSRLYVVAHRTGHPIDAYEVILYRLAHRTNVFWYYLGHEEAYWWGCSLDHQNSAADKVDIRAFGQAVAAYSVSNDSVVWPDGKRPNFPARKVTDEKALALFAQQRN